MGSCRSELISEVCTYSIQFKYVANANQRGFKLLWKKVKDLFPEMICALILVLAFWLKWCPSDDLCSKCQSCYKHKDCIFYTNFICKWVLSSCRKSGRHIANCFT